MAISLAARYCFNRSQAGSFLRERAQISLVASNTMAAMGGRMQLLLHGWLIVTWGHDLLYLIVFAAARILPKAVLTVPAGLLCDRFPRQLVLSGSRWACALASLLPLAGFLLPGAMGWLLAGIVLSGAAHVFDQPARRAALGDITEREQLGPVVALNIGSAHAASLFGSVLAFALGPPGLIVSATFYATAACCARGLGCLSGEPGSTRGASARLEEFFHFMAAAPAVSLLLLVGIVPPLLDKGLALALPSLHSGWETLSLALLAPDIGAIAAATLLFLRPARLRMTWIFAAASCYALLLALAVSLLRDPLLLVGGLALAGMAKSTFDTASQVRVQEVVPAGLRGRVFAL